MHTRQTLRPGGGENGGENRSPGSPPEQTALSPQRAPEPPPGLPSLHYTACRCLPRLSEARPPVRRVPTPSPLAACSRLLGLTPELFPARRPGLPHPSPLAAAPSGARSGPGLGGLDRGRRASAGRQGRPRGPAQPRAHGLPSVRWPTSLTAPSGQDARDARPSRRSQQSAGRRVPDSEAVTELGAPGDSAAPGPEDETRAQGPLSPGMPCRSPNGTAGTRGSRSGSACAGSARLLPFYSRTTRPRRAARDRGLGLPRTPPLPGLRSRRGAPGHAGRTARKADVTPAPPA